MNQLLGYDPKYEGFDLKYPSPPAIHWAVLLVLWLGISAFMDHYVTERWQTLAQSLVVDAWVFYLCNWLRLLDPESRSPFWCDVYVVVQLGYAVLGTLKHPGQLVGVLILLLAIAAMILAIATVFMIKSDLERHYNDREHAGLVLNGFTTFFFSFLYFQYHLYDIAKRRKRVAEALGASAYPGSSS